MSHARPQPACHRLPAARRRARDQPVDLAAAARTGPGDHRGSARRLADRLWRVREHLHSFTAHGAQYGICCDGGPAVCDDAHQVRLASLGLREGERFTCTCNFFAGWRLDLRLEQITCAQSGQLYPRCTGGRRAGPPEHWAGPWDFLQRTQPYLVYEAIVRATEIVGQLLHVEDPLEVVEVEDWREELAGLRPLLELERFDRRALNRMLAELAATERKQAA